MGSQIILFSVLNKKKILNCIVLFLTLYFLPASVFGQTETQSFVGVASNYSVSPNIVYQRAGGIDLKLDVYRPRNLEGLNPTLIYIHGGGWTNGSKEGSSLTFLPYLEMGWTVVNVAYRLACLLYKYPSPRDQRG